MGNKRGFWESTAKRKVRVQPKAPENPDLGRFGKAEPREIRDKGGGLEAENNCQNDCHSG